MRSLVLAATGLSVIVSATALGAVLDGRVPRTFEFEGLGGRVSDVTVDGFAWLDGVRPGQTVARFDAAADGSWRVETWAGSTSYTSASEARERDLADAQPIAWIALVVGTLAMASRALPRFAAPLVAISLFSSGNVLELRGDPATSLLVWSASIVLPSLLLLASSFSHRRTLTLFAVTTTGILVASIAARLMGMATTPAQNVLLDATVWLVVSAAIGSGLAWLRSSIRRRPRFSIRTRDVVLPWAMAFATCSVVRVLGVEPGVAAVTFGVGLLGAVVIDGISGPEYIRSLLARPAAHAAITASEHERARIAHDLHDSPLQELAGVIHSLDSIEGTGEAAVRLRHVASELRGLAVARRPAVLDDLGLAPAIRQLAERQRGSSTSIEVMLSDDRGPGACTRAPLDVEAAIYRIVEEAIRNAVRHSGSTGIRVTGTIRASVIDCSIDDSGAGLPPGAEVEAVTRGRLGLVSMRQRARMIGATLDIQGDNRGTCVRVRWVRS